MDNVTQIYQNQRPQREILRKIFVGREPLLNQMYSSLLERKGSRQPRRRHYFLIGQQGIGKTSLLEMLFHRLEDDPNLNNLWLVAALPLEPYRVGTLTDLILTVIAKTLAHIDRSTSRKSAPYIADSDKKILKNILRDSAASDCVHDKKIFIDGVTALRSLCKKHKVRILITVENARDIIDRFIRSGHTGLDLQEFFAEDWFLFIATSRCFLKHRFLAPYFRHLGIPPLTLEEQITVLRKFACLFQDAKTSLLIEKNISRLCALYHFTEGNPRCIIILYSLLVSKACDHASEGNALEGLDDVRMLVDRMTPYYQNTMQLVSSQEASLLEEIAVAPGNPISFASTVRMKPTTIRVLLMRLLKDGFLEKKRCGRQSIYMVPGALFRIWHKINRDESVTPGYTFLVDFFESWYLREIDKASYHLELGVCNDAQKPWFFLEYVKLLKAEDGAVFRQDIERLEKLKISFSSEEVRRRIEVLDNKYRTRSDYLAHKGYVLGSTFDNHKDALACFETALQRSPGSIPLLFNRAVALTYLGKSAEARHIFHSIIDTLAPLGFCEGVGHKTSKEAGLVNLIVKDKRRYLDRIAAHLLCFALSNSSSAVASRISSELCAVLEDATSRTLKINSIIALSALQDERSLEILLDAARTNVRRPGFHAVRIAALKSLGYRDEDRCIDDVAKIAGSIDASVHSPGVEIGIKVTVLETLTLLKARFLSHEETVKSILITALEDRDSQVQCAAIDGIGYKLAVEATELLENILCERPAPCIRARICRTLGQLRDETAIAALLSGTTDKHVDVRAEAATALGFMKQEVVVRHLMKLAEEDPSEDVRYRSLIAVFALPNLATFDQLRSAACALLRLASSHSRRRILLLSQMIILSVFRCLDVAKSGQILRFVDNELSDIEDQPGDLSSILVPYRMSLQYLESGLDDSFIYRQHQEMRTAVAFILREVGWIDENRSRELRQIGKIYPVAQEELPLHSSKEFLPEVLSLEPQRLEATG